MESTKNKLPAQDTTVYTGTCLTLRPPVFSFIGVRKGSKIMWLVSMFTGDCLFPTEQRFQAEFTSPQKDGTAVKEKQRAFRKGVLTRRGTRKTERSHHSCRFFFLKENNEFKPNRPTTGEMYFTGEV